MFAIISIILFYMYEGTNSIAGVLKILNENQDIKILKRPYKTITLSSKATTDIITYLWGLQKEIDTLMV